MLRLARGVRLAATVIAVLQTSCGVEAAGKTCLHAGLAHLQASSPDGYSIYRQVADPAFFAGWVRCDDAQFDLSTAVHESTHVVTTRLDAFPLIGGGAIALPHEASGFYPPNRIADQFKPDDFTTIYLRLGQASSSTDFLFLLDELDAYSHDLATAVDLKALATPDQSVDHRDGLAALMAFVAVYAETAKAREPETWAGLRRPEVATAVAGLWRQAEHVMASSCGIPAFGTSDKAYIQRYCTATAAAALTPILGRAPVCPRACLRPDADPPEGETQDGETPQDSEAAVPEAAAHRSTAGPSWIEEIIRSKARDLAIVEAR